MAAYKVWLTVKDSFGNTKEVAGPTINIDLDKLSDAQLAQIEEALPLEDYIKRENLAAELEEYATDLEVEQAIDANEILKYSTFDFKPDQKEK